jgi:hypothetical protein
MFIVITSDRGAIDRISILYLTGMGRSGTTLLSRLLDLERGYRAVGEVRTLTDGRRVPCGCGAPQVECDFWQPILGQVAAPEANQAWETAMRTPQLDQMKAFFRPDSMSRPTRQASELLHAVYGALAEGGNTVVDESKTPWIGYLLASQPWADVRFVELVRHPSDIIRSRMKAKNYQDTTPREVVAKYWLRTCLTNQAMRRRVSQPWYRVPFTDLANQPQGVLETILGRPAEGLFLQDGVWSFESPVTHIFRSNSDKLRRGPDAVRPVSEVPTISPSAGPWEKLANRYWDAWLANRVTVRQRWTPPKPCQVASSAADAATGLATAS